MENMMDSVQRAGILTPVIVRKKEDDRYELVSGHRRKRASEMAGNETIPAIIRDMSRDEAVIFMVDSNLQRERILPSEKAFSYKMRLDAMKRQAGRPIKDNSATVLQNYGGKTSREILAEKSGESHEQIRKYIRLTDLIPDILRMVDNSVMKLRPAVELSYLPKEEQTELFKVITQEESTPSHSQAIKLRQFSQEGKLNSEVMQSIMQEEKPVSADYRDHCAVWCSTQYIR